MALNVGDLFATLRLDSAAYEQSVQEMNQLTSALGPAIATAFVAAGAAAAAGLGAVVMAASDMQRAVNGLQASTGATDAEMQGLEGSLKNIYNANYGQSFEEVGTALAKARQETELSGKALEDFTTNAFAFADTFGEDVNMAVEGANQLMRDFNITQEEAWNLMAQGAQKGLNKNGELVDTIKEYSPQFKALGFGAEDMFNKLINGAKAGGWSVDKVADAVKEFNIRAKDGSKTSTEAFKTLGMDAEKMTATFAKGGPEAAKAFDEVVNAIANMKDPVEQNAAAVGLFGTQFEDLEMDAFKALSSTQKQVDKTKNAMDKIKEVKYDSIGEAFQGIWRNIQTGLIDKVNKDLMPAMNDMVAWFTANLPTIQAVFEGAFTAIITVLTPVVKAIGFFIEHIEILGPAIGAMAAYIIGLQIPAMWAWATATWAVASAQVVAFAPVLLTMAAIGVAVGVLAWVWKKWGTDITAWVSAACSAVVTWFQDLWTKAVEIFNGIMAFFQEWGLTILVVLSGPIGWLVAAIVAHWDSIKAFTIAAFTAIRDWLVGLWTTLWGYIGPPIMAVVNWIVHHFNVVKTTMRIIMAGILALMQIAWNAIWGFISPIVSTIVNFVVGRWNWLKGITSSVFAAIKGVASSVWSAISGTVSSLVSGLSSKVSAIWNTMKSLASSAWNSIKSTASSIWNGIASTASSVWGRIKDAMLKPVEAAKKAILDIIEAIKGAFAKMKITIPKPKLPKVSVSVGSKSIKGVDVPYPKFDLSWFAKGGIATGPSVVGIGEAGDEAIVPLQGHRMKPYASEIARQLAGSLGGAGGGNITIEVVTNLDGREVARVTAPHIDTELERRKSQNNRARGIIE